MIDCWIGRWWMDDKQVDRERERWQRYKDDRQVGRWETYLYRSRGLSLYPPNYLYTEIYSWDIVWLSFWQVWCQSGWLKIQDFYVTDVRLNAFYSGKAQCFLSRSSRDGMRSTLLAEGSLLKVNWWSMLLTSTGDLHGNTFACVWPNIWALQPGQLETHEKFHGHLDPTRSSPRCGHASGIEEKRFVQDEAFRGPETGQVCLSSSWSSSRLITGLVGAANDE